MLPPTADPLGLRGYAASRGVPHGAPRATLGAGGLVFVLYADEFGHDGVWDPHDAQHCHHPMFGLAGIALPGDRAREFDRSYLALKKSYFAPEIAAEFAATGKRPERFEWKDLRSPRDIRFSADVLRLVARLDGTLFIQGAIKPVGGPHDSAALYGSVTQGLMRCFEKYVRNAAGRRARGVIILDRRQEARDVELLASAQSYLFSAIPPLDRLLEVPLLVRSEWHHGVQAADNVCRVVGKVARYRCLADPQYEKVTKKLGPLLDAITRPCGPWSSAYIR